VGASRFVLVHVTTPLAVCERRDTKGLYARARRGAARGVTGVDDPYEPPPSPDVTLDASTEAPERLLEPLLARLRDLGALSADADAPAASPSP
jgi:sulfate adenylyltransferase